MVECEHKFVYGGIRYRDGKWALPGTGARRRYYAHVYYCERCLEKRAEKIDIQANTYERPQFDATPGMEVNVPQEDR